MTVRLRGAVRFLPLGFLPLGGAALAEEVSISRSDCQILSAYEEGGADYRPGVTVDGKAVAPADLNPQPDIIGPRIFIPLEADMMQGYGIGPSSPLRDSNVFLGVITVEGSRVYFNGQLLGDAETRYLSRACLEKQGRE